MFEISIHLEILVGHWGGERRVTNEQWLWAAVIGQAIEDASGTFDIRIAGIERRRIRDEAFNWLFKSKNTGTGSFLWICEYCGLDFIVVRRLAMEKMKDRMAPPLLRQGMKGIRPDFGTTRHICNA